MWLILHCRWHQSEHHNSRLGRTMPPHQSHPSGHAPRAKGHALGVGEGMVIGPMNENLADEVDDAYVCRQGVFLKLVVYPN